jgi:hypothetical protein
MEKQKDDKVSWELVSSSKPCSLVRREHEAASAVIILVEKCGPNDSYI